MSGDPMVLRSATGADVPEIASVFRVTRNHNLPYLPKLHTLEEDLKYFKGKVLREDQVMVADVSGKVVGFCASREGWVDHLYILPEYQGRGIGTALLDRAKRTYPDLRLWVFQKNTQARRFYEANGFTLAETTDGANNEEKEPDARYVWSRGRRTAVKTLSAASLGAAGVLFVLYPAIRPFSDETSLHGAVAFGSSAWLLAHMLAMVGFTLLPLGLLGLYSSLQGTSAERPAFLAFVLTLLGVGLTLPFYGGEAFGLHAIGQEAIRQQDGALVGLANVVRSGPGLIMILVGLLLLAVGAIMAATAIWKSGMYPKWSGIPFALGFALYIPQFAGTQPIRVAHGLLVAVGCLWLGAGLWQRDADSF